MLIEGPDLPSGYSLRADVVVVGAGPAGLTLTAELLAAGRSVLLLEAAGRNHHRSDDDSLTGDSSGDPFPLVASRHRGFGGTSGHWTPATGLRVRPLDAIDFQSRPGGADVSWPFGRDELDRYYARALESLGLDPDDRPARWFGSESPTPLAWDGGPQLAMFQFADHDCFTRRYDDLRRSPSLDIVFNAAVSALELADDGRTVSRARVVARNGVWFSAVGDAFVVACGAIDNARLLLASPGVTGTGIGNEHDNLGRYFMDHLSVDSGHLVAEGDLDLAPEAFRERRRDDGRAQPMLWLGDELIAKAGLPNAAFWIDELDPAYLSPGVGALRKARAAMRSVPRRGVGRHLLRTAVGAADVARYAAGRMVPRLRRGSVLSMRILAEQLPSRESRIRLSARRDGYDIPLVDLQWRISRSDLDVVVEHQRLLDRVLGERGVARLAEPFDPSRHQSPVMTNYHHIGGTRMHIDPRRGVVDPDGRVHSTSNLFVVGSSVFPSGGYLNPTLTIIALAIRTAEAVAKVTARHSR